MCANSPTPRKGWCSTNWSRGPEGSDYFDCSAPPRLRQRSGPPGTKMRHYCLERACCVLTLQQRVADGTTGDRGLEFRVLARRCSADAGSHRGTNKNWSQQRPAGNRANGKPQPCTHAATSHCALTPRIATACEHEEKWYRKKCAMPIHWKYPLINRMRFIFLRKNVKNAL